MGKKKRRNVKYDPVKKLSPICFPEKLEDLARDLYEKACKGSEPVWDQLKASKYQILQDQEIRQEFYKLSHQGMRSAQDKMLEHVFSTDKLDYQHELLFRGIADTMAWQMIGNQLCYARQLFKEQYQPNLYSSSLDTVVAAANFKMDEDKCGFSLISDLTSFVQVGDLLSFSPNSGFAISEVKSGKNNQRIHELFQSFSKTQCAHMVDLVLKHEDKSTINQMQRMMRQANRMSYVSEVMKTGKATNPDTNQ